MAIKASLQDELRKAQKLERKGKHHLRIIPLLLDGYLLDEWNDGLASDLRSRLGVEFKNWDAQANFEAQIGRLLQALERKL